MEVSKFADATDTGDMGVHHKDALPIMRGNRGYHSIVLERREHIRVGDAKILLLGTLETADADDTERVCRLECASANASHLQSP